MSVLEIKNLKKDYTTGWPKKEVTQAVNNLNISISQGEIYGFLGPNGAGKTTTIKTILGFITPTSGEIKIFGQDHNDWKTREKMGFLPDNPMIFPFMTGYQALYVVGKLFSLKRKVIKQRIEQLARELGLDKELRTPIESHSRGMRQRTGLAQALINDPDLIIMDEPMSGLDPIGRKMFREVILRLKQEGKTVFFSSHILADIEMICDRIGIIHRGGIVYEATMDEAIGKDRTRTLEEIFMQEVGAAG